MACKTRKLSEEMSKLYRSPFRWEHIQEFYFTSYETQNGFFLRSCKKKKHVLKSGI